MNVSIFQDIVQIYAFQTDTPLTFLENALYFIGLINLKQRKNSKSWMVREKILKEVFKITEEKEAILIQEL